MTNNAFELVKEFCHTNNGRLRTWPHGSVECEVLFKNGEFSITALAEDLVRVYFKKFKELTTFKATADLSQAGSCVVLKGEVAKGSIECENPAAPGLVSFRVGVDDGYLDNIFADRAGRSYNFRP